MTFDPIDAIDAIADRIEAELRRRGSWSASAIDPARLVDMGPFGMNKLAADEWIQFVLVPRIRERSIPESSGVAVWATRELDGDPDGGALVDLLRELDDAVAAASKKKKAGDKLDLIGAVAAGRVELVTQLLRDRVALEHMHDPDARDARGLAPLHVAAAGGSPLLDSGALLSIDLGKLEEPTAGPFAAIASALLDADADPNIRSHDAGLTPLMIATWFGRRDVIEVLRARGADPSLRDTLARTVDRFVVFPTIARVIRRCRRLEMVKSAYVAQIHAPATQQYTSPVLGLELTGALPADALGDWPADEPIIAFLLGEDAVSRLIRLMPPVYTAPSLTSSTRAIAAGIARAFGEAAIAREVPTGDDARDDARDETLDRRDFAIVLPDGRAPILVRGFGHLFGVVVGDRAWHLTKADADVATATTAAALVAEVAAAAHQWSASNPSTITMLDIAIDLVGALENGATRGQWTVKTPGTNVPTEMWLHGPAGGSVGVFPGSALVWIEGDSNALRIATREDLVDARARVVALVAKQRALHERDEQGKQRIAALIVELSDRLSKRIPLEGGWKTSTATVASADGKHASTVTLRLDNGVIFAHAGLPGDGWDAPLAHVEAIDAAMDAIVAAIEVGRRTFTVDDLAAGRRYRVLRNVGELVIGNVVRFEGYHDIDNHYCEYEFVSERGRTLKVTGDPCHGPLDNVHWYLEELTD